MKKYLSHGMGVNSTALMLLLEDEGIEFENVFVNHGGDYPETYEYLNYLQDEGRKITVLIPNCSGCHTIEEYALKHNLFPGIKFRWCTMKFKVDVLHSYYEHPCIDYIGISAEEAHRCRATHPEGLEVRYLLVEKGLTRKNCEEIIAGHGLKIPRRSGCWCCPFMRKAEVRRLFLEHPDLYKRRKHLEENVLFSSRNTRSKPFYLSGQGKSVSEMAMEHTPPLTSFLGD